MTYWQKKCVWGKKILNFGKSVSQFLGSSVASSTPGNGEFCQVLRVSPKFLNTQVFKYSCVTQVNQNTKTQKILELVDKTCLWWPVNLRRSTKWPGKYQKVKAVWFILPMHRWRFIIFGETTKPPTLCFRQYDFLCSGGRQHFFEVVGSTLASSPSPLPLIS